MEGFLCLETLEEMGLGLARGMRLTASCAFEGTMGVARHCTRGPVHLLATLCAFHLPPPVPVAFLSFLYLIPLFFVLLLALSWFFDEGKVGLPWRICDRISFVSTGFMLRASAWWMAFTCSASRAGSSRRDATFDRSCYSCCVDVVPFASPTATPSA